MTHPKKQNQIEKNQVSIPQIDDFKLEEVKYLDNKIDLSKEMFSSNEQTLIKSLNYQKIGQLEEKTLKNLSFVVLNNALRSMSSRMDENDRVLLINDFTWELSNHFKLLSIKEFELIVHRGIRRQFNTDTIGLSIVNFNIWYKAYMEERNQLQIQISNKIEKEKRERPQLPPAPLTIEDAHTMMKSEFDLIKHQSNIKNVLFFLSSDFLYRILVGFNSINESEYLNRIKEVRLDDKKRNPLQQSMEAALEETKNRRISEAKRLVLIDYLYKNLIKK